VHGHQQLSLFNGHYDERCFLPIHVYDTATSRPVAVLLRTGKTPSGIEIRGHVRRLVRRIRRHWPNTRITIRGDSHYGRPEVMAWCEANRVDYILGLSGNAVLDRLVEPAADDVRVRRAEAEAPVVRRYTETAYGAKSWGRARRVAARIEATTNGLDIRYVVTNLTCSATGVMAGARQPDGRSLRTAYDDASDAERQEEMSPRMKNNGAFIVRFRLFRCRAWCRWRLLPCVKFD
jgi:hypothetical protein